MVVDELVYMIYLENNLIGSSSMNIKKRVVLLLIVIAALAWGCTNATETPVPTLAPRATPISLQDYDTGPDFDCWHAPGDSSSLVNLPDELIVDVTSVDQSETIKTGLFQIDPHDGMYQLLAPGQSGDPYAFGESISPLRNAIGYIQDRSTTWYHIYDVQNNLFKDIPEIPEVRTIMSAQWSSDGQCVFFELDGAIGAYRISDGKLQRKSIPGYTIETYFDQSPDGQWWAWGTKSGIIVVNLEGERLISPVFEPPFWASDPKWSPDGRYLAFAYDMKDFVPKVQRPQTIRIVDLQTTGMYQDIFLTNDFVINMQWTNDSNRLLIESYWPEIMIYDVSRSEMLFDNFGKYLSDKFLPQHSLDQYCFSNDGKKLYFSSYSYEKGIRIDDLERIYVYDFSTGVLSLIPLPSEFDNHIRTFIEGLYCVTNSSP